MKIRGQFLHNAALKADLPGERAPGTSLIEVFGRKRVLIENHNGIKDYSKEIVCAQTCWGDIVIDGKGLTIVCMTKHQLVISGDITGIQLKNGRL